MVDLKHLVSVIYAITGLFMFSFIYSFSKYMLNTYDGPNIILSTDDISANKTVNIPALRRLTSYKGETGSKWIKSKVIAFRYFKEHKMTWLKVSVVIQAKGNDKSD